MYGMVNKAIEEMVCQHHGEDAWERIRQRAGVDVEVFVRNQSYDDVCTYQLVGAAAAELGVPAQAVLRAFGEYWVQYTGKAGYQTLMSAGGSTLQEFLVNLPNLHTRVIMLYPKLVPPRFECTDVTEHSLRLHYHSHRQGLTEFVVGLVRGLGLLFDTPVEVELLESRAEGADHDVFAVSW